MLSLVVTSFSQVTATVFLGGKDFGKRYRWQAAGSTPKNPCKERKVRPVGPTYDRYKWSYNEFMGRLQNWPKNQWVTVVITRIKRLSKELL